MTSPQESTILLIQMKRRDLKTNWHHYYTHPYPLAGVTRGILSRHVSRQLKKLLFGKGSIVIAEFGGANSFVYPILNFSLNPAEYHIIDKYPTKPGRLCGKSLHFHEKDILDFEHSPQVDVTLSIGLIEHFGHEDMKKAVRAHMNILKPGGVAVITFPTPTWLYKISRRLSELLGSWIFFDERALTIGEVERVASQHGTVLSCKIIWATVFTQAIFVIQKFSAVKSSLDQPSPTISATI